MHRAWNNHDAEAAIARYLDVSRDLGATGSYIRLLGQDPRLVLHGGKARSKRISLINGEDVDVLCVEGFDQDMGGD